MKFLEFFKDVLDVFQAIEVTQRSCEVKDGLRLGKLLLEKHWQGAF